jgi:hypothetical protein
MKMSMSVIICEYEKVKEKFPQFSQVMSSLRAGLVLKAQQDWPGLTYGGMNPRAGQFGISTVMPQLFNDISGTQLVTWHQNFTATGHQIILAGTRAGGIIPEDYKVGICGLALLDKAIRISEIKMQISDLKLGRINIEEAFAYNKPAVVFEDWFLLDEETGFDLYAYVLSQGVQTIKLIGAQVNRVPNKMQVTVPGQAL